MVHLLGNRPDAIKQPGDKPDHIADHLRALPPPPVAASARYLVPSVLNQGGLGSCTTNAAMLAIRASHIKQFLSDYLAMGMSYLDALAKAVATVELGSRLFPYYFARAYSHETAQDAGTELRLVFMALNKFGFPAERLWPYSDDASPTGPFQRMPGSLAIQAAYDQKSPTIYQRIVALSDADLLDQIRRAINAGYLVNFGTDVTVAFTREETDPAKPLAPPSSSASIAGGHALTIAEYDGDDFGIPNSWGPDFGIEGWFRMSGAYLTWSQSRDFWIVKSSPRYS